MEARFASAAAPGRTENEDYVLALPGMCAAWRLSFAGGT